MKLTALNLSPRPMWRYLATVAVLFTAAAGAHAQAASAESQKLAAEVELADVHMHLYKGLTPQDLQSAMDRNRVKWGGGVGPVGPGYDPLDFSRQLGNRYFPTGGQAEQYEMFVVGGAAEMQDPESPRFKALLVKLASQFEKKEISGVGELILNNRRSTSYPPNFGRKVPIDASVVQTLFELVAKHKGFVQIHMDDDDDSIQELKKTAANFPSVPIILSHCMTRATAAKAKALLEQYPNLYCETSFRSTARMKIPQLSQFMIHTETSADPGWVVLIEAMPDRFMVGSDIYSSNVSYDEVIAAVRSGLLARLSPPTLKKVAYENAQRLFGLQ